MHTGRRPLPVHHGLGGRGQSREDEQAGQDDPDGEPSIGRSPPGRRFRLPFLGQPASALGQWPEAGAGAALGAAVAVGAAGAGAAAQAEAVPSRWTTDQR